jgi:hypothetical protein
MKNIVFILLLITATCENVYSQQDRSPFTPWKLTSYSGQISLKGNYRSYENTIGDITDKQTENFLNAIIQLNTQSYIIHPNFLLLNVNGIYNPETRRRQYIGIPDNSEKNNREGVDATALLFQKKNFNLNANASFYNNLQNIDNLTRVKEKTKYWGAVFSDRNKYVPFSLSYNKQISNQKTLETERTYNLEQELYQLNATKSFGLKDHHSFNYLHTNNSSEQNDPLYTTALSQNNSVDVYELSDDITNGKRNGLTYASAIAKTKERGNILYESNTIQQSLSLKLPYNFSLLNSYNYRESKQDTNLLHYNRFQSILSHQLFASLTSRISFEHWQSKQDDYNEKRDKIGTDLRYQKKLPEGKLIISYGYNREYQSVNTLNTSLFTFKEEYILDDNNITMLKNEYVEQSTIVVKDITGSIIYHLNLDYILINHDPYTEIVRVPGGLIPNGGKVYIDYVSKKPGKYKYVMSNQSLIIEVWTFKNIFNTYYRLYTQGYDNQMVSEFQVLNTQTRQLFGSKIDLHTMSAGVEYEFCQSSILPYSSIKYFFTFQKNFKKIMVLANGNYTDYKMKTEESRRKDLNLQGKFSYTILPTLKTNLDYSFRSLTGRGIDMKIHTCKLEITTQVKRLYISAGTELYWSESSYSNSKYKGAFIQITRNF